MVWCKPKSYRYLAVALFASGMLAACGGGGGSSSSDSSLEGRFVDGPVEGLRYRTETLDGTTGTGGQFRYRPGETVEFILGGTSLGRARGAATLTPISLVPGALSDLDQTVGNIAQLLQSIDDDADPANGIQISAQARQAAQGSALDIRQAAAAFAADPAVADLVARLTAASSAGARALVDRVEAQIHLRESVAWNVATQCERPPCLRVTQMWSAQFAGVTNNGFDEARDDFDAGQQGNSATPGKGHYILMAVRQDNVAHFTVALASAGDPSGVRVRMGLLGQDDPLLGPPLQLVGASRALESGRMELTVDFEHELPAGAADNVLDFFVTAGVDVDNDGELDLAEVTALSTWRFRVVSRQHYQSALALASTAAAASGLWPWAQSFLTAFLTGTGSSMLPLRQTGAMAVGAEIRWQEIRATHAPGDSDIDRAAFRPQLEKYPFSHKVGIDYASPVGLVGTYEFDSASELAALVRGSASMQSKVMDKLFAAVASGVVFPRQSTAFRFTAAGERDLNFSFGTIYVDVRLFYNEECSAGRRRLHNVELRGRAWDLYDWNYSDTADSLSIAFPLLASVQAGYGTLGAGLAGQVFEIHIDLGAMLPEYENHDAGPCFSTRPTLPCASIAGDWNVVTTYRWICHGAFSGASFSGTRQRTQSVVQPAGSCTPSIDAPALRNSFLAPKYEFTDFPATFFLVRSAARAEFDFPAAMLYATEIGASGLVTAGGAQMDFAEYGVIAGLSDNEFGRCLVDSSTTWHR